MEGRDTLEGTAQLLRQLAAIGSLEDGKALRRSVKAGINEAYLHAQTIIPVGTVIHRAYATARQQGFGIQGITVTPGFAKRSLRTISTLNKAKNVADGILSVRVAAFYAAVFLELGTYKMPSQKWLRRSLIESRDKAEMALRRSLEVSVVKAAKTR